MRLRSSFLIITVLAAIHGLSAQAPAARRNQLGTPPAAPQRALRTLPLGLHPGETITIQADALSATVAPGRRVYRALGHAQITGRGLRLSADRMTYDSQTGEAVAVGHVAFDSPAEQTHIEGLRANYNFLTATGEFDDFQGVSGIRMRGRRPTSISANPLIFSGKRLERLGPRHYRLVDGTVTSCTLPSPVWSMSASRVDIVLGQNATLHHAVFRLFSVPIFYAPFLTHSTVRTGRHSGLLVPEVGKSNIKGYSLGDSFYWAAARNVSLTLGGQYYSARGWADQVRLDSMPTRNSAVSLQLNGVFDRGLTLPNGSHLTQGGQELRITGDHETPGGFRTVLDADYLSSYLYRLVFNNTFAGAINSEAVSTGFTEKQWAGEDFAVIAHRYQNFLGNTPTSSLSLAQLPSLDWNAYAQALDRLPVYFSWDANGGLLDRSEPGFATGVMERVDLAPEVTVPLTTPAGVFTGSVGVDSTYYSERQVAPNPLSAAGAPELGAGGLWRNAASAGLEWRPPALEKVYSGFGGVFGDRMEHVFEPQVGFHATTGVKNANDVIRFDARDILTNTRELEYGFTNRLLAAGKKPGQSRELISWTLLQKYFFDPTFGGALVPGARNAFLTTEMLSPFDIEALPLRFSPLSSVVRVSPFAGFDGEWRMDYDSHSHQITASAFTGNFHFGNAFFSGSHYLLRPPLGLVAAGLPPRFDQLRLASGYGSATSPGTSIAGSVAYDALTGQLQYTTLQVTHNWDCFGISVEYRRFSLATVRRENQFLISISLSNVGTFGNLKRQDQLF
jgi:LPS-assembly protein